MSIPEHVLALQNRVMSQATECADAIVWLQGNRYARGPRVLEIYRAGGAPTVIITGTDERRDEAYASDGVHVTLADLRRWMMERGISDSAILIDGQALHTRAQAVRTIALASSRGWRSLLLVASPHHQLRAFLTFLRAAEEARWNGRIVNQPANIAWDVVPPGRLSTSAACFEEEVEKMTRYRAHVASIAAGHGALDSMQLHLHTGGV